MSYQTDVIEVRGFTFSGQNEVLSVAPFLNLPEIKAPVFFYGYNNSRRGISTLLWRHKESQLATAQVSVHLKNGFVLKPTKNDLTQAGMVNLRYTVKETREYIYKAVETDLTKSEVASRDLDAILLVNTDKRLAMIRKAYPNLEAIVVQYKQEDFGKKANSLMLVIDESCIDEDFEKLDTVLDRPESLSSFVA